MGEKEYLSSASRTLSPQYNTNLVPTTELDMFFQAVETVISWADKIKKSIFYGKAYTTSRLNGASSTSYENVSPDYFHGVLGIFTESGEMLEALYNCLNGSKKFDIINLNEEMGDVYWYLAILHNHASSLPSSCWATNIAKLKARYPDKFSQEKALVRDLDTERKVLEDGQSSSD